MKVVALILFGVGIVLLNTAADTDKQKADKEFVGKQIDVLDMFWSVHQPATTLRQKELAAAFSFEQQQQNSNNPNAVRRFQNAYQQGFLPRGEVFNYNNPNHLTQAIKLFDVLYFAKDYDTFIKAAAWARSNINEGIFHYAASVAVLNRPDTQGIVLFPRAENNPFFYINGRAILQAQLHKQLGEKEFVVYSNNTNSNAFNQDYIHRLEETKQEQNDFPFTNEFQNENDNENQANQYQARYQYNFEGLVSYYNEDINLNQQFALEQLKNPAWFTKDKYQAKQQTKNQNNGENFYYYLQQLLARYNLERHANYLPNVYPLQFNSYIEPGYNPKLIYFNGQVAPARPNYRHVNYGNPKFFEELIEIDRRISDVVSTNQAVVADGSKIPLNAENGVKILGNIIQNNGDSPNNQFYAANNGYYGYLDQCRRFVASTVNPDNTYDNAPAAIDDDNSANRDPAFYQCLSRVINFFQNFKNQLKPYNQEQLGFPGVKVQSINIDKLISYFNNREVDLFNSFFYKSGKNPDTYNSSDFHPPEYFRYIALQQQLNHKPFNYQIQVTSDKDSNAVVRVFLGPKYNSQGRKFSLEQTRQNFVEIDRFSVNLKNGGNTIQRSSEQSTRFVQDNYSGSKSLYKQITDAKKGTDFFYNPNFSQLEATFPQNLIIPKGNRYGREYLLAVVVSPSQGPQDTKPQGFPFDRVVRDADFQQSQNIYFQTVRIFNKNEDEVNKVAP